MKATRLRIEILSTEEEIASTVAFVHRAQRAIARGERVTPLQRLVFRSVEDLRRFLTPERVRLLRLIRSAKPRSVYELARLAERDRKAVATDLQVLVNLGLVHMSKARTGGRARSVPRVPYSSLGIKVPA